MADPTGMVTPTRPSRVHVTPIALWELGDLPRRVRENLLQAGLWLFMIGLYDIPQDPGRFRSDAPPAEHPWHWDPVLWPPIAVIGTDDTGALEPNGFPTAMIHWSPLYMVARNFLSLTGAVSNLTHLYSRISDALFLGVLYGEPVNFAGFVFRKLVFYLRKFQTSTKASTRARDREHRTFNMMPVLLRLIEIK
ncbi:hypothetical protein R1sor_025163 [Riccia sorocarpa]|uniref:Uncharacterized protein n=1 Tax=Riccia sorocarpa TaxID=122646 RepID=A0ABD3GAW6_9MARC